ncbi:MAG: HAMP domain-containing histidine kinase [Firmicutes bacterium]|nr:HAMP domain-containing histidine kinase [Bacillota bacterium]
MKKNIPISNQLVLISFVVFIILTLSLTIFVPKSLSPYFEETVYNFLNQPFKYFNNISEKNFTNNIVYLQVDKNNNNILISENANDILKINNYEKLLSKINGEKGKFKLNNNKFYYVANYSNNIIKITITDTKLINNMRSKLFVSILPVLILTFLMILISLLIWCNFVVHKINILINKVKNLNNDNYDHSSKIKVEDELQILEKTIEDVRIMIKEQESFKNEMYQNISHDFKTPISVIKSYLEAYKDGVINEEETRVIIEEQINKLDSKVRSLLQLNKLEYLKEHFQNTNEEINIVDVLNKSVEKFSVENKKIKFKISYKKDTIMYRGTIDMWESIIDNLLGNFMRYAKNRIEITATQKRIVFYNDGEPIDETIITDIFSPYKKGIKGQFGLGLSIVSKTCRLLDYNIKVENVKKGVKFIIEK